MAIFGSAKHDENGKYSGGNRGDLSGTEVAFDNFYVHSKGWTIIRARSTSTAKKIADAMIAACNNEKIGYSQSDRDSLYNAIKNNNFNINSLESNVNTDCSALVRVCVCAAGILVGDFNTSSEVSTLLSTGNFTLVNFESANSLSVGDILVTKTKGHTVVVVSQDNNLSTGGAQKNIGYDNNGGYSDNLANSFSVSGSTNFTRTQYLYKTIFEKRTYEVVKDLIKTVDTERALLGGYSNLLSYPSLVETPFILFRVGNYTFGKYTKSVNTNNYKIDYPNYINSMEVTKINGLLNLYSINLSYQVSTGDDPNLLDKIFSSVGYGKVYITYGDYSSPSFIYKEEEAIITKVTSLVDFSSSRINYSVSCTSSALLLASKTFNFPARKAKPSDVIFELLSNNTYGLLDIFTGMKNKLTITTNNLIATDDKLVEILKKSNIDPLSYIQYLVTCMSSNTNNSDDILKDSTYRMTLFDDNFNDLNLLGTYFKITKIKSSSKILSTNDVYQVDVGYPTDNLVMSFSVNTDNSWQLLYKYNDTILTSNYTYDIDNKGNVVTTYSPNIATSETYNKMTESLKTWWTDMTLFPIQAQLVLKGLVRPTLLMTYIRINALFFGLKHISSGLYIITGLKDSIGGNGYRTTLSLTRIAGDNDYIQKVKTLVTSVIPVGYEKIEKLVNININNSGSKFIKSDIGTRSSSKLASNGNSLGNSNELIVNSDKSVSNNNKNLSSSAIKKLIWNYLMSVINNSYGVAGLMGNLLMESGCDPKCVQGCYNKSNPNLYNTEYTNNVDSGNISKEEFIKNGPNGGGYGLALWTWSGRKKALYELAKSKNTSIGNLSMQLEYLVSELRSYNGINFIEKLSQSVSIVEASNLILMKFELPADLGTKVLNIRAGYGLNFYNEYGK